MANVAIVTKDLTFVANTEAALVELGHSVSVVLDSALLTTDFSLFDVVYAIRCTLSTTIASNLRTVIDTGKPMVIGIVHEGNTSSVDGTSQQGIPTFMGLSGNVTVVNGFSGDEISTRNAVIYNNTHPIAGGFVPGVETVYSDKNFIGAISQAGNFIGVGMIAGDGVLADKTNTFATEAGTTVSGSPTGARVVVSTIPYAAQSTYTASGIKLLENMLVWATNGVLPPDAPLVATSEITTNSARISGGEYVHPNGFLHLDTQVVVTRQVDSVVVYSASLGAVVQVVVGELDPATSYIPQMRYQDQTGQWSGWGLGAVFVTLDPSEWKPCESPPVTPFAQCDEPSGGTAFAQCPTVGATPFEACS